MKMSIDRSGVAAVEFALIAPMLVMLAIGFYDLAAATTIYWHLTEAADAVGQIATNSAANPNQTNSLTRTAAYAASTAIYALVPQLTSAAPPAFGVVLTSVVFTPCTSPCTYTAAVAWSHALVGSAAARACGALTSAADSASPSATTLPADAFSAAPMLVVDVSFYVSTAVYQLHQGLHPDEAQRLFAAAHGRQHELGHLQRSILGAADVRRIQLKGCRRR